MDLSLNFAIESLERRGCQYTCYIYDDLGMLIPLKWLFDDISVCKDVDFSKSTLFDREEFEDDLFTLTYDFFKVIDFNYLDEKFCELVVRFK